MSSINQAVGYFAPACGWQRAIDEAKTRNVWVHGGRQIGKSRTFIRLQLQAVFAGYSSYYSCPSTEIAENNWLDLCNAVSDLGSERTRVNKVDKGVIEVVTGNGRRGVYRRLSGAAKGNMRGARAHTLFHDELQLTVGSQEYFANTSALTLTTGGRTFVAVTSPDTPQRYYGSEWMVEGAMGRVPMEGVPEVWTNPKLPDWTFVRQPTLPETLAEVLAARDKLEAVTPRSTKEYVRMATDILDSTRGMIGDKSFRREYLCAWEVDAGGGVIDQWRADRHVTQDAEYDPALPFFVGIDEGRGVAKTAIVFAQRKPVYRLGLDGGQVVDYETRVFDELTTTSRVLADALVADLIGFCVKETHEPSLVMNTRWTRQRPYGLPTFVAPDPRAPYVIDALKESGLDVRSHAVPVEQGVARLNRALERGKLLVHPRCSSLISEMGQWERRADGSPKDAHNDSAQALTYLLTRMDAHYGVDDEIAEARRLIRARQAAERKPRYLFASL